MDEEEFLGFCADRRSVREFLPKPIEFEKIVEVVRAGSEAPSAGDLQPWKFVVVTDDDLVDEIANLCPKQGWMHNAQALIAVCGDTGKMTDFYGENGERWCAQGCAAAVQNMLLAAHAQDLGACWVGSFDAEALRDALQIPDGHHPEAIVALGYPDETPRDKQVRPLHELTYFNAFGNTTEDMTAVLRDWGEHFRKKKRSLAKRVGTDERSDSLVDKAKQFLKRD